MRHGSFPGFIPLIAACAIVFVTPGWASDQTQEEKSKAEARTTLTEEIVVVGEAPKDRPISSTSQVKRETIEAMHTTDLTQPLAMTTGTFVSLGTKNEFGLKVRGLDSRRVSLMYDGIPISEPYFGSFDVKTIMTDEIEDIRIVKGASSVLYGPNTLGGVVDIITKRPTTTHGSFTLMGTERSTVFAGGAGSLVHEDMVFTGTASFDKTDGYPYEDASGKEQLRANSDYDRKSFSGKFLYYPGQTSELMAEASYYTSEYGIPWATQYYKPRYWHFKDWNRFDFNAGGTFGFRETGQLKVRAYYVRYYNVLDSFKTADMNTLDWESTFKNDSAGATVIGSVPLVEHNDLKFSFGFRSDKANTQDDVDEPVDHYDQRVASFGIEDHVGIGEKWKLVAGAGVDYLDKMLGDNTTSFSPLAGIKYNPVEYADIHLSVSRKTRFATMKELYSPSDGNPDLQNELGTSVEVGFAYDKQVRLGGAVFYNSFKDLINSVRRPDGSKYYENIDSAQISGFEMEVGKPIRWLDCSANYTYLNARNQDKDLPLDLVPSHQFNFMLNGRPGKGFSFALWGVATSECSLASSSGTLKAPGYFLAGASVDKTISVLRLFLRADNLFNKNYVTEPGYPMPLRRIYGGVGVKVGEY